MYFVIHIHYPSNFFEIGGYTEQGDKSIFYTFIKLPSPPPFFSTHLKSGLATFSQLSRD